MNALMAFGEMSIDASTKAELTWIFAHAAGLYFGYYPLF